MWDNIWEEVFSSSSWGKYPAEPLIRFIAKNYYVQNREAVKIFELGCGPGANLWFLAREGFSFYGVDGSQSAVNQARNCLDAEFPEWRSRGSVDVADITKINYGNDFDAVIDNECVYCMPFDKALVVYEKARSSLKPGGKLFIRTFSNETWGFGTGKKIAENMYECDEGPLSGKGASRFTFEEEIPVLLRGFRNISIEKTSTSYMGQDKFIVEWLIEGTK